MFPWFAFLSYTIIMAYTPGPNNIMSMNNSAKVGLKKSLPFNAGIFIGQFLVMLLCMFFSTAIFSIIPKIEIPMKILAASYMLYLAYSNFISSFDSARKSIKNKPATFISGVFLQFVNAKFVIYGITALTSFVIPFFTNLFILFIFCLLLSFIGISGNICWTLFGAAFSKLFEKYSKIIACIMSALLIYCAISLFI